MISSSAVCYSGYAFTFAAAGIGLILVALLARRATKVDPLEALRYE